MKESVQQISHGQNTTESWHRAMVFRTTLILFSTGFALLTFLITTVPSFPIDLQITKAIQLFNSPVFAFLMKAISWPGFGPQSMVITVLIALSLHGLGLRWEAVMAVLATLIPMGINFLVKILVQRPRPTLDLVQVFATLNNYSFPSGHVMFYLGFFGFIAFLVFSFLKPSLTRSLLLLLLGMPIVLIGASRIYLGAHWASDVLGAYLLGMLTLIAIVQLYLWGKPRFFSTTSTKDINHVKK